MNPSPKTGVWRILDAEANRASEAARVVEDYTRFVLDDLHLTDRCKQLRHQLASVLAALPAEGRLEARETQQDVGTRLTTEAERSRADANEVAAANVRRLEQALRSLEEYSKTLSPDVAARFERLRYDVYTLERATAITAASRQRVPEPALYVLVDGGPSLPAFSDRVASLVQAGVTLLQLRDKSLGDRDLIGRARALRQATRGTRTMSVINDRPDIAALADADGVHVGQEELSVKDVRTIVGPGRLIGVSTHSIEQARQAVLDGAGYIGVGPVFDTRTKSFDHFPGLDLVRAVAAEITLPAFAIGGVAEQNLDQVLATGSRRIAVSSAVVSAADPPTAARRLLAMLGETTPRR